MIYDTLKNRKHVREYNSTESVPISLIDSMLKQSWEVTPSKNNFMPYNIHVIGPDQLHYKEDIYRACVKNEEEINKLNPNLCDHRLNPNYMNILSCSHLLLFTVRVEDQPNEFQKIQIKNGIYYESVDKKSIDSITDTISLEVGLFANTFSGICLENDIDTSYTMCFSKNLDDWIDFSFVKNTPILIMTVGKGKLYRQDVANKEGWAKLDLKPEYNRIVNFL
jgi:hypothetical protein